MTRQFYVYILTNRSNTLYVGMTSNIQSRMEAHRHGSIPSFASKYLINKLVYVEPHPTAVSAITREKQLKKWRRAKKLELIGTMNPQWNDLSNTLG